MAEGRIFKFKPGDIVEVNSKHLKGLQGEVIAQYFRTFDLKPGYTVRCGRWLTIQAAQEDLKKLVDLVG